MISNSQLQQRLEAAREFDQVVGHLTFRLRVPTRAQMRSIIIANGGLDDDGSRIASLQAMTLAALVSVKGATTKDIGLDGESMPLPESAAAAKAIAEDNLEVMDALKDELTERVNQRNKALETDLKN